MYLIDMLCPCQFQQGNFRKGIAERMIDGVQIRTNQGYVDCRVHLVGDEEYLDWVRFGATYKDGPDGYAGIFGRAIDGVQMR